MSDNTPAAVLDAYWSHLERSPLSAHTRRAYWGHATRYVAWLADRDDTGSALTDSSSRDFAVRDWRRELKDRRLAPASVNSALAALDHLYRFLGLGPPDVRRETLPALAPRALSDAELRAVLRATLTACSIRDRAAIALMAFAGLRVAETASLDVDDVALSARKGTVTIHYGKGGTGRTVPLCAEARGLIEPWMAARARERGAPLFSGPDGRRLSVRALDRGVRRAGHLAGIELSPHVLRHTFVTRLVRSGADVVLVAELAGHRSLETTRRYALPTEADRAAALEVLAVDP